MANYPHIPQPIIQCKHKTTWINGLKYVTLLISYEFNHVAKSKEWRDKLLNEIFEKVMTSIDTWIPDLQEPDGTEETPQFISSKKEDDEIPSEAEKPKSDEQN